MIAMSCRLSNALTETESNISPLGSLTVADSRSWIMWKDVTIFPSVEMMNPLPDISALPVVPLTKTTAGMALLAIAGASRPS